MRFSTRTRYGLRFLIKLSQLPRNKKIQLGQFAQEENISAGYLEQIVRALKPSGILEATRGNGGGYCLAKDPADINMEEIFCHLEGDISPVGCLSAKHVCKNENGCTSRVFWQKLDNHIREYLRTYTLEQIRDYHLNKSPRAGVDCPFSIIEPDPDSKK